MIAYPNFDPVAVRLGPIAIHWYGLMYLTGFAGCWWLGTVRARMPHVQWPKERIGDLLFYVALGVILGGRVGYTLFYNASGFIHDPLVLFRIWEGGMSFHGGLLGVAVAMILFARHFDLKFWDVSDFSAVLVPLGLFTGRLGNFINGELWGKPTDLPWGMVFPHAGPEPRHPSMLYEAALEGLVLLAVLWWFGRKPRPRMAISGLFAILYATFRMSVESVRLPDVQIGYLAGGWLTMGILLSIPLFLFGVVLLTLAYRRNEFAPAGAAPGRDA